MKEYILDANIIFSSLLSGKDIYKKIFENYKFYTSDFAFLEIEKYQNTILTKTRLTFEQLQDYTLFIFSRLIFIPDYYISRDSRIKAYNLCHDIDFKDIYYLALSIELEKVLITRDKPLYKGLKAKSYNDVILFNEFIASL